MSAAGEVQEGALCDADRRAAAGILGSLNRWIERLASFALLAASLVLTSSVVMRYFLNAPSDWQDEMSVFLIVGAVFLSSASVQAVRGHVGIEAIASLLPPRVDRIRRALVDLASALFCGFFSWKAWALFDEAQLEGYRTSSSWAPPLWIPYLLMALGMSLLTVQIVGQLVASMRKVGVR